MDSSLAPPDENGEVGLDIARPGQTVLRLAQKLEEPFVAGISLAEISDETGEQRIQEASTGRVLGLRLEPPSRDGKYFLASRRLGRILAPDILRILALPPPEAFACQGVPAEGLGKSRK